MFFSYQNALYNVSTAYKIFIWLSVKSISYIQLIFPVSNHNIKWWSIDFIVTISEDKDEILYNKLIKYLEENML